MKKFYFLVPGMVYGAEIWRDSEREVRAYIRWAWGVKRCPNGTQVWS